MKLDQHLSAISGTILIIFFCIITVFMRYISQQNPLIKSGFALVLLFFAWILIYQFYKHLPWPYDLMIVVVLGSGITSLVLLFKSHIFHQILGLFIYFISLQSLNHFLKVRQENRPYLEKWRDIIKGIFVITLPALLILMIVINVVLPIMNR